MNFFDYVPEKNGIAAHRGNRSLRPENTRASFEAAIGCCHFVELDVQMSRDGIPVIHHDRLLGRTSDGVALAVQFKMKSTAVCDWDLARLRSLDLGTWFLASDPFQTIAEGEVTSVELLPELPQPIMTLAEILVWANFHDIPLNIELKDQEGGPHDKTIVQSVLSEIQRSGFSEKILISSFRHDYLRQIRAGMPELPVGVLQEDSHPQDLINYLKSIDAAAYHPEAELVDTELMQALAGTGIAVNVFTVNSESEVRRLFDLGVAAIFTDFPLRFFSD